MVYYEDKEAVEQSTKKGEMVFYTTSVFLNNGPLVYVDFWLCEMQTAINNQPASMCLYLNHFTVTTYHGEYLWTELIDPARPANHVALLHGSRSEFIQNLPFMNENSPDNIDKRPSMLQRTLQLRMPDTEKNNSHTRKI